MTSIFSFLNNFYKISNKNSNNDTTQQNKKKRMRIDTESKDTKSGDIKIGISNNPKERKKEIQNEYNVGHVRGISITVISFLLKFLFQVESYNR